MSVLMLPKWGIDIASLFSHEGRPRAHRPVWGETDFRQSGREPGQPLTGGQ